MKATYGADISHVAYQARTEHQFSGNAKADYQSLMLLSFGST